MPAGAGRRRDGHGHVLLRQVVAVEMSGGAVSSVSSVVIDGYNLINRVPDLARRAAGLGGLEASRSYLLGWLRRYQAVRRRRVVLVLDGPSPGRSDFGPVEVIYCTSADDGVTCLAGPGTMVVTSDTAVAAAARGSGADVISSEDSWMKLTAGGAGAARNPKRDRGSHRCDTEQGRSRRTARDAHRDASRGDASRRGAIRDANRGQTRRRNQDSGQRPDRYGTWDKDGDGDESPGFGQGVKRGNPRPRSKAERRRARARAELLRKV